MRNKDIACHASIMALAMTNEVCRKQKCKPGNLHHFYERQQKRYAFPLQKSTVCRIAFDAAKGNKIFGHIQCQRSKGSSRGKRIKGSSTEEYSSAQGQ